jgi:hypothetical protein
MQGEIMQDPLRRGLTQAVQWFDCLLVEVERHVDEIVERCRNSLLNELSTIDKASQKPSTHPQSILPSTVPSSSQLNTTATTQASFQTHPQSAKDTTLKPGQCHPYLRRLCPSCFGGNHFGKAVEE